MGMRCVGLFVFLGMFEVPVGGVCACVRLKSSVINVLVPGKIPKIHSGDIAFKHIENLQIFIRSCKDLGIPGTDLFQPEDLYENKNFNQVVYTIHSLGAHARRLPNYTGPTLGAKLAERNERHFTEEQLMQARTAATRIAQGSTGGANQSGMVDRSLEIDRNTGPEYFPGFPILTRDIEKQKSQDP
eukprot:TRINITY_DN1301_c0_g1_i3.p2 TRINITY_DN1301_c0_g1~~TRINITY_DN1301_c0_g1_i3.p2  ORF type:complete len:186 (-),score=43.31 TRINITY_DN1301_c0_g1_i3:24-581(-)